jgi:thermolabile hemolysin
MRKCSIVLGLAIAATLVPGRVVAATFSQLVVYGDSLSDLNRAFTATGGAAPRYVSTPTAGRFSNGPIWVEYLADSLGITTDPNTNFAVGGATTGRLNTVAAELTANGIPILNPSALVGIQQQVTNSSFVPDALYIVWGGANDYLGGGIVDPTIPVSNLTAEISTLIARGAKNILVPNLPNLGALPGTRTSSVNAPVLSLLTQGHNAALAGSIEALRRADSSLTINILDVNDLFTQAVNDPGRFNFSNVTDGCLVVGCSNPDAYLFWDPIHPTTAAHRLIGNLALSTVAPTAVPEPFTIIGTIVGGTAALRLRKKLKAMDRSRSHQ